jgi:hypothetical protein
LSIRIPILLKLLLHRLVLHGNMNKSSFLLVLCECTFELVMNSFRLVFMYTRISYIYRLCRGNICNDLKCCLQLMFFGICTIALIALNYYVRENQSLNPIQSKFNLVFTYTTISKIYFDAFSHMIPLFYIKAKFCSISHFPCFLYLAHLCFYTLLRNGLYLQ